MEVPNLENVDAFFSDPLDPAEGLPSTDMGLETQHTANTNGPEMRQPTLDAFSDSSQIIQQTNRALSSSWKFNPFRGAHPQAFDREDPKTNLTEDEWKAIQAFQVSNNSRPRDVALRHHDAIGQIELAKINKRNKKHLSLAAWPEDTVGLNDEGFHKEINAFYGLPTLPSSGQTGVQSATDDCLDRYQEVSNAMIFSRCSSVHVLTFPT